MLCLEDVLTSSFFFSTGRTLIWLQGDGLLDAQAFSLVPDVLWFLIFSLAYTLYAAQQDDPALIWRFTGFHGWSLQSTLLASCYKELSHYILLLNLMTSLTHWISQHFSVHSLGHVQPSGYPKHYMQTVASHEVCFSLIHLHTSFHLVPSCPYWFRDKSNARLPPDS